MSRCLEVSYSGGRRWQLGSDFTGKTRQLWEPGLPAMAVGQVGNYRLIHRDRSGATTRQASSHRFSGVAGSDQLLAGLLIHRSKIASNPR
jgi:hypothetical protein